ncbi:MAG TPA: zf-HC2 domain-containing protein [Thermoanaerobaculia bacterium]|nr:zf-HC2 domain-containing protein [Thermoanaerobaculia bacterium]
MPMNCDEATEYLPWLLNGSLGAGESGEVRRHLATCERCRAALNDTRDAWTVFSQHLPSEALVALAYGETPAGLDPALVERHLASCPECAAELELARTSRRLEEDDKIAVFPGPRREMKDAGRSRSWRASALAAGLAALVAGTGWVYEIQRVAGLEHLAQAPAPVQQSPAPAQAGPDEASRRKLASLEGDLKKSQETQEDLQDKLQQLNGQVADLASRPRGGASEPQIIGSTLTLPAPQEIVRGTEKVIQVPGNQTASLTLETNDDDKASRRVEILDAGGRKVWGRDGLPQVNAEYQIILPAAFLKPGRYTIQLYASGGRKAEAYAIRVQ